MDFTDFGSVESVVFDSCFRDALFGHSLYFLQRVELGFRIYFDAAAEGISQVLPHTIISPSGKQKRIYFGGIRPTGGQAFLRNVGFDNPADNQFVASQVQNLDDLAAVVDWTLLDKRNVLQLAVKNSKVAVRNFIDTGAGSKPAIIGFLNDSRRRGY